MLRREPLIIAVRRRFEIQRKPGLRRRDRPSPPTLR